MTVVSLALALRRFWVLTLAGLCLAGASVVLLRATPSLYHARVGVYFSPAETPSHPNALARQQGGIVEFVGVVERSLTQTLAPPRLASPRVLMLDEGVSDGVRVSLPNAGGQWDESYPTPMLDVQVVARAPEEVRSRATATLRLIDATARSLQANQGVDESSMVVTNVSPPPSVEVHEAQGPTARAGGVLALMVLAVTAALADGLDRKFPRRSDRLRRNGRRRHHWLRRGLAPSGSW